MNFNAQTSSARSANFEGDGIRQQEVVPALR